MPYRVIYSSEATKSISRQELEKILTSSRIANEMCDITGVLVFTDGVFLQVLEGQKEAVVGLMGKIVCDPRHRSVTVFSAAEIESPVFSQWRMAHLSPSAPEMAEWIGLEGAVSVADLSADLRESPDHVSEFLQGIIEVLSSGQSA